MTVLAPMPPEDFAAFTDVANANYAQDNVLAGRWTQDEALARARAEFAQLLPQGLATPGHLVYAIRDDNGDSVGFLWVAVLGEDDARSAYVYNVGVYEAHRRKGHARAALAELARIAAALGARSIRLNVFAHNPGAIALYRSLGFEVSAMTMRKPLPPRSA